jgi:hypothetical protein
VYPDDHPSTGTPQDDVGVVLRVGDDDTGSADAAVPVTVHNVDPVVCVAFDPATPTAPDDGPCPAATATIDEGGSVTVRGAFSDPGLPDTHTITIDWGDPALPDSVLSPAAGTRDFSATRTYGDDGSFTVSVTVTDDDTGTGTATATVVVENVDPTATIAEPPATGNGAGYVLADGPDDDGVLDEPTMIVRRNQAASFSGRSTDPGSDDLDFGWDWDASDRFDTTQTVNRSRVNPPADDPFPSPTLQPRDVTDVRGHAWTQPCLYQVVLTVSDDDGGSAADDTWVVVTGTDSRVRAPGYWFNQYDLTRSNSQRLSEATLGCYLEIVRHLSRVFDFFVPVDTFEQARDILNTKQTSNDRQIMQRQLLAAWLNVANGSTRWFDLVDTDGNRTADTPLHVVLAQSEALRLDPTATRAQLLAQENVLKIVNGDR